MDYTNIAVNIVLLMVAVLSWMTWRYFVKELQARENRVYKAEMDKMRKRQRELADFMQGEQIGGSMK